MKFAESTSRPGHRKLYITAAILLVVILATLFYVNNQINGSTLGAKKKVLIPPGATVSQTATILQDNGVIDNATWFRLYTKINSVNVKAGKYELQPGQSFSTIVKQLNAGPTIKVVKITIPEGYRLKQIAARVAKTMPGHDADDFLQAATSGSVRSKFQPADVKSLEGLLFPDTYFVDEDASDAQILQQMVDRFDEQADKIGLSAAAKEKNMTPYEVITLASLVEREARRDEDRAKVASVIYNRLAAGQALQIDATAQYATQNYDRPPTKADLQTQSPYNTYVIKGLPPGPIASPGLEALQAAIDPDKTSYIYYVTINDCTGETVFSATFTEHNQNIARRSRENPSDCSTTTTMAK